MLYSYASLPVGAHKNHRRQAIACFGGKVLSLMNSPLATGLFHKAIGTDRRPHRALWLGDGLVATLTVGAAVAPALGGRETSRNVSISSSRAEAPG